MNMDVYASARAMSGKLKLKAKARLADGRASEVFEACVLLHEAAREERRAVRLVDAPQVTRFAALVEACFCLVEGLDPHTAGEIYSMLYQERAGMDSEMVSALLSRLTPRYEALQRKYADAVGELVVLKGNLPLVPTSEGQIRKARAEAKRMTSSFPGVAGWWWVTYRLEDASDQAALAWEALSSARRLEPDNMRFEAISLLAATKALDHDAADEYVAGVRGRLDANAPELCLMYALAELRLARNTPTTDRDERWRGAQVAVRAGLAGEPAPKLLKNLRATDLLLESYIRHERPSVELLYLAGLHELAIRAGADEDVGELLTREVAAAA